MTKNIDKLQVGARIRSIRETLGLTMDEFANKIDSKAQKGTVSNWENGKNLPNKTRLSRIASLGQTTPELILYGDIPETIKILINEIQEYEITKFNSQLYKQLYDPKIKQEITDLILERYSFSNLTSIGIRQYLKEILNKVLVEYEEMNEYMPYSDINALTYSKIHLLKLSMKIDDYFKDENAVDNTNNKLDKNQIKENLSYELYLEIHNSFNEALHNLIKITESYT